MFFFYPCIKAWIKMYTSVRPRLPNGILQALAEVGDPKQIRRGYNHPQIATRKAPVRTSQILYWAWSQKH
jgi:hypothetical protein